MTDRVRDPDDEAARAADEPETDEDVAPAETEGFDTDDADETEAIELAPDEAADEAADIEEDE